MNVYDELEKQIKEVISMLQERHAKELAPWFNELAAIQAMRPPRPILVTQEQARGLIGGDEFCEVAGTPPEYASRVRALRADVILDGLQPPDSEGGEV